MFRLGTKALTSLYPRSLENKDVIDPGNIKKPAANWVRARRDGGGGRLVGKIKNSYRSFSRFKNSYRTGKMAPSVKCLLCSPKDLSSIPRTYVTCTQLSSQCWGGKGDQIPGTLCSQIGLLCEAQVNERPCLKKQGRQFLKNNFHGCPLHSTHTHKHMHAQLHTHAPAHTGTTTDT